MKFLNEKNFAHFVDVATKGLFQVLKCFFDEEKLKEWKPIHLCWWFEKHGLEIPKNL